MAVLLLLIAASLGIALLFLWGFVWAVRNGQFEDTCTPSLRVLMDEQHDRSSPSPREERASFADNPWRNLPTSPPGLKKGASSPDPLLQAEEGRKASL